MKKLMLVALSMVMSSMVFAHGGDLPNRQNQDNKRFWQDMNGTHDVMHNTAISEKQLENGISFEITAVSDSSLQSIRKKFIDEQAKLETYLENIDVTVHALDKGVEVILESENKDLVKKLNASGRNIVYRYLHLGNGRFHGQMGGGYGPGMMHGWGSQNGMGPSMMYENGHYNQNNSDSHDHMGYGPGMM